MSYEAVQLQLVGNNVLRINHPSLPATPASFLTTANSAGGTSLTVRDNNGFTNGDLILVGDYGTEQAEIKQVNGAVSAGTSLTTTAMTFAHAVDTMVRKILFDKIEIYGNSSSSSSGSTLITTINIDPTSPFTEYVVTGTTYAYYGVRAIRSVATTYNGDYSDFIQSSGYDTDMVGFIIARAFEATGMEVQADGKYSRQWAYDQIFLGEQDVAKARKKWSWLQEFSYDAGNVTLGVNHFTAPTNMSDKNSPRAIQGLRLGTGKHLTYMSKAEYDALFQNTARTTVGTTYVAAAGTVILTDSRDFTDAGSFNAYTNNTIDSVSYTTNTRATNTLTGVTSNDSGATAGDPVWQNEPAGVPQRFTIFEGEIYFDMVPDLTANLVGTNIWLDYYKKITRVNSDGDTITVPDSLCIQFWLETQIKRSKSNGTIAADDASWIGYQRLKKQLSDLEVGGQGVSFVPEYMQDYEYH